jgi:hypothetical protein
MARVAAVGMGRNCATAHIPPRHHDAPKFGIVKITTAAAQLDGEAGDAVPFKLDDAASRREHHIERRRSGRALRRGLGHLDVDAATLLASN